MALSLVACSASPITGSPNDASTPPTTVTSPASTPAPSTTDSTDTASPTGTESATATTEAEATVPLVLLNVVMDGLPFGEATVVRAWPVGSGTGELGIELPDGSLGFGMPRAFDFTSDGSLLIQDVVNDRWLVEAPSGDAYQFRLPDLAIGDVWDALVGPHDVLYVVTDDVIAAYRFGRDEVVQLAVEPRPAGIVRGGFIRETTVGVAIVGVIPDNVGQRLATMPYVDRDGESIGDVVPRPSTAGNGAVVVSEAGEIGFVDGDIDPRFADISPVAANARGSGTDIMVVGYDGSRNATHTAIVVVVDGVVSQAARNPLWDRFLPDAFGTSTRLHDGALYTVVRTSASAGDLSGGLRLVRIDPKPLAYSEQP